MKPLTDARSCLALVLFASLTALMTACGGEESGPTATQAETQKRLVQRIYEEGYNGGNLATVDELLAPDYVNHQIFPGLPADREGIKLVIGSMRTAFPDLNIIISDMRAEGDMVYVHATITGTHQGPLSGIQPTGRKVAFETIDSFRLVNGQQVEHWGVTDQLGLMIQLGALSGG